MPRVGAEVGREAERRAVVDWGCQRSSLEKDYSCKNFMWDFM